jgi:hypothetical protein
MKGECEERVGAFESEFEVGGDNGMIRRRRMKQGPASKADVRWGSL